MGIALVAALGWGCREKRTGIAELTAAEGPVERQVAQGPWANAALGTIYYLGDAARTAAGGAQLKLVGGNASIKMEQHTVLRFGQSKGGAAKIAVELGAILLVGGGNYGLDVGDVTVGDSGSVRITAGGGGTSRIELLVGTAQIAGLDGQRLELEIGKALELGIGPIRFVDAGVADAPLVVVDAGIPDAPPVVAGGGLEVTGKRAEILRAGETKWQPLPAGPGTLEPGSKIRLGHGTTATLQANGLTLSMASNSRGKIGDSLELGLELGAATASVPTATEGQVGVPGGDVLVKATADGPGRARVDVNANGEARIAVLEGSSKLKGALGTELDMKLGESAALAKVGGIRQTAKIPDHFDLKISVGETPTFTIHDPRGSTALQFVFGHKCPRGGTIEMDDDPQFRTARITGGKEAANILADAGSWSYRLVCSGGGAVASGRIIVRRDAGTRPLPKSPPVNPIDADGRTYRISYQSLVPDVKIKAPAGGSRYRLHLAMGTSEETFESNEPSFKVDGKKLKEATYTYWVDKDGVKQQKVSTLIIDFDQTAPQVYIESPPNGKPFGAEVDVRGAVLPGWAAKVDAVEIPIDKTTRRFVAPVPPPTEATALAIRLSHPQRGVHFYLRREQ